MGMPTLSQEVQSVVQYIDHTGVPYRVTSTFRPPLSTTGSYHGYPGTNGVGLAVDFAEPAVSHDTPGLLRIFSAFGPAESRLAEAIYYDAPYCIKNGKRVNGFTVYGRTTMEAHRNHVHIAVPKGTFLMPVPGQNGGSQGGGLMPDYEMQGNVVAFVVTSTGKGYYVVTDAGEIFGFGDAAYLGRTHKKP